MVRTFSGQVKPRLLPLHGEAPDRFHETIVNSTLMTTNGVYIYGWNSWEAFLLNIMFPGAGRIKADLDEDYRAVAEKFGAFAKS